MDMAKVYLRGKYDDDMLTKCSSGFEDRTKGGNGDIGAIFKLAVNVPRAYKGSLVSA